MHTVRVDRVADSADVTKRTIYRHDRSKDGPIATGYRNPDEVCEELVDDRASFMTCQMKARRRLHDPWGDGYIMDGREIVGEVDAFIGSWSEADLTGRFGSSARSSRQWLIDALRHPGHFSLAYRRHGETVHALLDAALLASTELEVGIVVSASLRRRGIATAMLRGLEERLPRDAFVYADCAATNVAAIGLLRRNGFHIERRWAGTVRWRRVAGARRGLVVEPLSR